MNWAETVSIIAPAMGAALLVLLTHVPLGCQVLRRGIVFIDLAIAQIAALGVIAAGVLEWAPQGLAVQAAAAASALAGAAVLAWMERRWPEVQEAQIGALFVLAATGGVLLLAHHPHGGEHLRDLLAGQILWVGYEQLLWPAVVGAGLTLLLLCFRNGLPPLLFYAAFALAVTVSVQLVGVYLVFASLILPALGSRRLHGKQRLLAGYGIGVLAYVAGLLLSMRWDLPSGALIVWCLAVVAATVYALSCVCTRSRSVAETSLL